MSITTTFDPKAAWDIVGGLSTPSKMPCYGYSIPAPECKNGSKLRAVQGSVCSGCYAMRGNYRFKNIQAVLYKRMLRMLQHPLWLESMIAIIRHKEHTGHFRIFDSGDLQSADNLAQWVAVANALPHIKFWLPTREYGFVTEFKEKGGIIPDNMTIRLSAMMVNGPAPLAIAERLGVQTSAVSTGDDYNCPAPKQNNECGACRNCWNKSVATVTYHKH